jgi:hypothetical protein
MFDAGLVRPPPWPMQTSPPSWAGALLPGRVAAQKEKIFRNMSGMRHRPPEFRRATAENAADCFRIATPRHPLGPARGPERHGLSLACLDIAPGRPGHAAPDCSGCRNDDRFPGWKQYVSLALSSPGFGRAPRRAEPVQKDRSGARPAGPCPESRRAAWRDRTRGDGVVPVAGPKKQEKSTHNPLSMIVFRPQHAIGAKKKSVFCCTF